MPAIVAVVAVANTEKMTRRQATPARNAHLVSMLRALVLLGASLALQVHTKTWWEAVPARGAIIIAAQVNTIRAVAAVLPASAKRVPLAASKPAQAS